MQPVITKYRAGEALYCKSGASAAGSADVGLCGSLWHWVYVNLPVIYCSLHKVHRQLINIFISFSFLRSVPLYLVSFESKRGRNKKVNA